MEENNILSPLIDSLFNCGRYIFRNITTCELPSQVPYKLQTEKSLIIKIGKSYKYPISINLRENPNTFIVGSTGSGKSVCTKTILTSLVNKFTPQELELYLCDLKRVELNLFQSCSHVKDFSYKIDDVTKTIQQVLYECEQRYDLFMKNNVVDIFEYNKNRKNKLPYKILFIEEIVLLMQDKKHTALNTLIQLLSICRASGIYVFITTQRPSADILPPTIKCNINNRIVFKCEDTKNSIIALDEEGAEQLKGKGHGILKVGSIKSEFQGYFISSEQTKELIKPFEKIEENNIKIIKKESKFVENNKPKYHDIDTSFIDKL